MIDQMIHMMKNQLTQTNQEEARIEKEKLNLNEERKKIEAEFEKRQRALDIDLKLVREKRDIIELCDNEEDVALIENMIIREENQQPCTQ
ncbi:hypothetical protein DPMN_112338 [Dreissena polymorpha]|uniref:Uncharacterized protein n=1 Tax=Dreissena polymorpha TaxID=45954 RepID=A0A9D4QPN2_DREPO|nr:hypothetical protein DPMN_112338 [Dreissena polymorpha]